MKRIQLNKQSRNLIPKMIYLCKVNKQEKLLVMQWWTFNYIDKSTNEFFNEYYVSQHLNQE